MSFSHGLIKGCSNMISHLKGERSRMEKLPHPFYFSESNKNKDLKKNNVFTFSSVINPELIIIML